MTSKLLKPLAVFSRQSQSQQYIKSIKNLGDAWRTLSEEPCISSERMTVIQTTFDFILKITTEHDDLTVETTTIETPSPKSGPSTTPRHYRIFPEYGTDFLWRAVEDIREDEQGYTESEEELVSFPPCVRELYDVWVDQWSDNWKKRCEDTQDYYADVFSDRIEQVAWNVAGYMLAWRILLGPGVGSIEYTAGSTDYLLERGNEVAVTERFLGDQIGLLAKGAKLP
ncbi:hypothetical protein N7471_006643 [Penicillium samsonianum]|uniref:uncharacterized protein n=1 Tax=Penicillium samsonianum TaxID=1882272 RepID=UPI00254829CF|nr:uncharacterized protein N7471_006643 [Penicillium samsonianum]KAJ6140157.1 hypothetical protein N7471_006643 [Penicillium samsonianum]